MKLLQVGGHKKKNGSLKDCLFAMVDDNDFERANKFVWSSRGRYVCRLIGAKKREVIYLHRFILNFPKNMVVDHVNGDGLDNQRKNLRICTQAENARNSSINKNNTSGFKGVIYDSHNKKWISQIIFQRQIHLGRFSSKIEAAKAYNIAAKKYHKEFAKFNLI